MKFVKLFEQHIDEVQAQVVATQTIEVPNTTAANIKARMKAYEEYEKLKAEFEPIRKAYEDKMTPLQDKISKLDPEILTKLQEVNATAIKIDNIIVQVKEEHKEGKATNSYMTLWNAALEKVNAATKKVLVEMQEKDKAENKKKNSKDYNWLEFTIDALTGSLTGVTATAESVSEGEVWSKITGWIKSTWNKIKDAITGYEKAADDLEAVGKKILAANESEVNEANVEFKAPKDLQVVGADYKEIEKKGGLIDQFIKAFKSFGINVYEAPSAEGTDSFGFYITKEKLNKKQLKDLDK